jgi:four helix bundle protein
MMNRFGLKGTLRHMRQNGHEHGERGLSDDFDRSIDKVTAYKFAKLLAEAGWEDASVLQQHPLLVGVAPQLVRAIGSISANIAEGYARKSPRDRIRYYEYALGSVEESRSWFHVARCAMPPQTIGSRDNQLTSIRRLLLTMIANERRGHNWNSPRRA